MSIDDRIKAKISNLVRRHVCGIAFIMYVQYLQLNSLKCWDKYNERA